MSISSLIKSVLNDNKSQIELLQLSLTSAIAGLIYSEFIKNFKQVLKPVHKILIPEIKQIHEILNMDSLFMKNISDNLIDTLLANPLYEKYKDAKDFSMYNTTETTNNIEIIKTIVDLYILPNISRSIPDVISQKFGLRGPDNQMFIESNELDIFRSTSFICDPDYFKYIADQTLLFMLTLMPSVPKVIRPIENNSEIRIRECDEEILSIENTNAITAIHLNKQIYDNKLIMDLLSFVTSTVIKPIKNLNNDECIEISTNPFNRVVSISLG